MHSFTVNCNTFSNKEKVAVVVPVTSVEVTYSEAMLALGFSTLVLLLYVDNAFDENTGKVCTRVNGWQCLRWMSI